MLYLKRKRFCEGIDGLFEVLERNVKIKSCINIYPWSWSGTVIAASLKKVSLGMLQ